MVQQPITPDHPSCASSPKETFWFLKGDPHFLTKPPRTLKKGARWGPAILKWPYVDPHRANIDLFMRAEAWLLELGGNYTRHGPYLTLSHVWKDEVNRVNDPSLFFNFGELAFPTEGKFILCVEIKYVRAEKSHESDAWGSKWVQSGTAQLQVSAPLPTPRPSNNVPSSADPADAKRKDENRWWKMLWKRGHFVPLDWKKRLPISAYDARSPHGAWARVERAPGLK